MACSALDFSVEKSKTLFLFLQARSIVSSGVRLGIIGPYEGQTTLRQGFEIARRVIELIDIGEEGEVECFQTCPLIDILQGSHDNLYSRLFNS